MKSADRHLYQPVALLNLPYHYNNHIRHLPPDNNLLTLPYLLQHIHNPPVSNHQHG
jgi:hypothetical protein